VPEPKAAARLTARLIDRASLVGLSRWPIASGPVGLSHGIDPPLPSAVDQLFPFLSPRRALELWSSCRPSLSASWLPVSRLGRGVA